jgi:hypothetical protein
MFEAQAVWKTEQEGEFTPAGFTVMVEVEPVSTNVLPASMSLIFDYIRDDKCDGFIIDLGTKKKYVIGANHAKE